MSEFILDLYQITDEESAKSAAQILIDSMTDNATLKDIAKDFLNKCHRNFEDDKAPSKLKFYTLYIFKYLDSKEKSVLKIFSLLTGHPLFQYLVDLAQQIDPKKSVNEKGKLLFVDNKQLGVKFMRLLLETLKSWSERFPTNSSKEPTKFKKAVIKLLEEKVTFPTEYIYYTSKQKQKQTNPQKPTSGGAQQTSSSIDKTKKNQPKLQSKQQSKPPKTGDDAKHIASQINFLYNKIQQFIGILEDENKDIDQLQRQITKYHQLFEKQQRKREDINIQQLGDQKIIALYYKINSYITNEGKVYEEQILKKDDLKSYCQRVLIDFDLIFTEQEPSKDQKKSIKSSEPLPKLQVTSSQFVKPQQKQSYGSKNEKSVKKSIRQEEPGDREERGRNVKNQNVLEEFFDKHLNRNRKDISPGFKAIKESIEKETKERKLSSNLRSKSPNATSTVSKSNASVFASHLGKSNSIFSKPPNPNPRPKTYEGTVIKANHQVENILYELKKDQGMKRFKVSNLKNRALLYQSQHIQIGYKSVPLYDEIPQYEEIIEFQIFIGNKSKETIRNLEITFQGDQRSLVYCNPQKAPDTINVGQQYKFQVVVIPRHQIYSLINLRLSCSVGTTEIKTSCILPSSILKFTTYRKIDKRQIRDEQSKMSKIYQSEKFNLCHYFAPRKLPHYIQQLVQMTDYTEFSENASETDFVMAGHLIIKQKLEGIVRIIVRPDLSCVLQLRTSEQNEPEIKALYLYLQTLQMVLKEAR